MSLDEDFAQAAKRVNSSTNLDNAKLLELYGLYKQATTGDATGSRPSAFDVKGRAKFDAWAARKGMTQDAAKQQYIASASKLD
jgi:diazepam-binding inhibitor (GABA receptor modulator, acyl-CoA-binding protein)